MQRTKIVATLGPASSDPETIARLLEQGVDVFRLNFSHGTREEKRLLMRSIRELGAAAGRAPAIMQDLCGPKIRTGEMKDGAVELVTGATVTITAEPCLGTPSFFSTSYGALSRDVKPGDRILLDDGAMAMRVASVGEHAVVCHIERGGWLGNRKGVNLPDTTISSPSVTPKDLADLDVGLDEGVDFVALSFVRHPDDLKPVRDVMARRGTSAQLIAKIEKPEALTHLAAIIDAADGVLVARGDLGVEMDLTRVPLMQKEIVRKANEQDKIVIVATQMLESMIHSATPTRAEVSDVSNAIIDGADAVMLSGETAVGSFPIAAVSMMARIIDSTEGHLAKHPPNWEWAKANSGRRVQDAIAHAAFQLCMELDIRCIVAFSPTGGTGLFLSKSRPFVPILVFTPSERAFRQMRLFWGIQPVLDPDVRSSADLLRAARTQLPSRSIAKDGDRILLVTGTQFGQIGATNAIEVAQV